MRLTNFLDEFLTMVKYKKTPTSKTVLQIRFLICENRLHLLRNNTERVLCQMSAGFQSSNIKVFIAWHVLIVLIWKTRSEKMHTVQTQELQNENRRFFFKRSSIQRF